MTSTARQAAATVATFVLILGDVNVRKIMRQRPELFRGATVARSIRKPRLGARADWNADYDAASDSSVLDTPEHEAARDKAWRARSSAMFAANNDEADEHADQIALDSAGMTLVVIASTDVWEHMPAADTYCQIPGTRFDKNNEVESGPYFDLLESADEVIYV